MSEQVLKLLFLFFWTKATLLFSVAFFLFPACLLLRNLLYRINAESAERDINNAVCAEDDNKPDDAPHDGSLPVGSLRFIPRSLDEFKHAPKEEDKSRGREKQDKRIDYLRDDLL